jgi:hypothetical protein
MKIFKTIVLGAALVAASLLTGCDFVEGFISGWKEAGAADEADDSSAGLVAGLPARKAIVNGNTVTYGDHTYTIVSDIDVNTKEYKKPTASVTFSNIPSGYAEFEAVYNGLLGKSIAGTAAMIPMAIELYARDAETGERCLDLLCNGDATVSNITRILKTKLVPSQYAGENDSYIQRYMAAALLKGAVNTNAYTPDRPYTVEMTMSPNGVREAPLMGGDVTYIYILAQGWDTNQRGVDVFLPYDTQLYKVSGCSSCYTQCKNIRGTWPGLE